MAKRAALVQDEIGLRRDNVARIRRETQGITKRQGYDRMRQYGRVEGYKEERRMGEIDAIVFVCARRQE